MSIAVLARVCAAAIAATCLWQAFECIPQGRAVIRARAGGAREQALHSALAGIPLVADQEGTASFRDVRHDARALIFVYSSTCPNCARTIASWVQLAHDARGAAPDAGLYALSIESLQTQRKYWEPLSHLGIRLLTLSDSSTFARLGTETVPATLVVHNGYIVSVTRSVVGPRARARILSLLESAS
jgi:hypothetical protein